MKHSGKEINGFKIVSEHFGGSVFYKKKSKTSYN